MTCEASLVVGEVCTTICSIRISIVHINMAFSLFLRESIELSFKNLKRELTGEKKSTAHKRGGRVEIDLLRKWKFCLSIDPYNAMWWNLRPYNHLQNMPAQDKFSRYKLTVNSPSTL